MHRVICFLLHWKQRSFINSPTEFGWVCKCGEIWKSQR